MRYARPEKAATGFTLIEVIVGLVLVAVLGTIIYTFLAGAMVRSVLPVQWVQDQNRLNQVMELIVEEYKDALLTPPVDFPALTSRAQALAGPGVTVIASCLRFVNNAEVVEPCAGSRILKITLTNDAGRVTNLFTR